MGLFDSMVKTAKLQQEKAIIHQQSKLYDAYHSTDDPKSKKAIAQQIRTNSDMLRKSK